MAAGSLAPHVANGALTLDPSPPSAQHPGAGHKTRALDEPHSPPASHRGLFSFCLPGSNSRQNLQPYLANCGTSTRARARTGRESAPT